jgi:hypothetical protein
MAITLTTAARNAACDAIVDLVDVGTTDANGDIVFMTSGSVEVATLALSAPAFGASSVGVATANTVSSDTSATGGTVALFKIQNKDNTEIFRGTVTVSSGDINLSSLTVGASDTVSMSSLTVTMPAS